MQRLVVGLGRAAGASRWGSAGGDRGGAAGISSAGTGKGARLRDVAARAGAPAAKPRKGPERAVASLGRASGSRVRAGGEARPPDGSGGGPRSVPAREEDARPPPPGSATEGGGSADAEGGDGGRAPSLRGSRTRGHRRLARRQGGE